MKPSGRNENETYVVVRANCFMRKSEKKNIGPKMEPILLDVKMAPTRNEYVVQLSPKSQNNVKTKTDDVSLKSSGVPNIATSAATKVNDNQ